MRIIARSEDPVVIKAILAHLAGKARQVQPRLPPGRAPRAPAHSSPEDWTAERMRTPFILPILCKAFAFGGQYRDSQTYAAALTRDTIC